MCIGREHDDSVSQGEQFIRIIIGLDICLIESKGELPNDSLDLLRLAGESKLAEEYAHGLVELLPVELHQFAVRVQYVQDFLIVLAEVLPEDDFIDALHLDDILSDGIGAVLVDEALGDVVGDGVLRFLVEHEDEVLCLLRELLVLVDVVQLAYQHPVLVLLLQPTPLVVHRDRVPVPHEVVLHLQLELRAALLGLSADHRVPAVDWLPLDIVFAELLQLLHLLVELDQLWRVGVLDLDLDF